MWWFSCIHNVSWMLWHSKHTGLLVLRHPSMSRHFFKVTSHFIFTLLTQMMRGKDIEKNPTITSSQRLIGSKRPDSNPPQTKKIGYIVRTLHGPDVANDLNKWESRGMGSLQSKQPAICNLNQITIQWSKERTIKNEEKKNDNKTKTKAGDNWHLLNAFHRYHWPTSQLG